METKPGILICQQCNSNAEGKYCSNCGAQLNYPRLTVTSMVHEVFHFFTHLEKGFFFTLVQLATRAGLMQKDYINGKRSKYQKPFSMFFVCGSLTAFALYLIHKPTGAVSHFEEVRSDFTRHYYVLLQTALLPFYSLVTWLLFRNNKINYAECLVLFLYTISFMLLLIIFTNLMDLVPNKIESPFYEIPILFGYLLWTNWNYFSEEPKWRLIIKSIINIFIGYFASQYAANFIVNHLL